MNIRIEFDGGSSCNIPRLGFGNGYGSYKIDNEPVHRCNFRRPMSANAAELFTLQYAVQAIRDSCLDRGIDVSETTLFIVGDSQVALGWAKNAFRKMSRNATPVFKEAVSKLQDSIEGFRVEILWQPRLKSVATFGH